MKGKVRITHNAKPIALVPPLSDSNFEETLSELRKTRAIDAVKQMQQKAKNEGIDQCPLKISMRKSRIHEKRRNKSCNQYQKKKYHNTARVFQQVLLKNLLILYSFKNKKPPASPDKHR